MVRSLVAVAAPTTRACRSAGVTFLILAIASGLFTGCTTPGGATPTPVPGGELSGSVAIVSNIRISGDQPITIVYTASASATSVSAFFVEVASTAVGSAEVGSEVLFATGLPNGTKQTVTFNVGDLALGIYRIGLNLSDGTNTLRVLSTGTIEITELPAPVFALPDQNLVIRAGTAVSIRATLGDPENAVQWRLFYIGVNDSTSGVTADRLGTEITTGTANEAIVTWNTGGIALGTYRIGLSVTDTGQSVAQTVAAGQSDRILTVFNVFTVELVADEPAARPPSVVVSQPSSDREVLVSEVVVIEYGVTVFEGPPANQTIDVFHDDDGIANSGDEHIISGDLPITTQGVQVVGSAVFSAALIANGQTVFVGVTADDGKNAPVTKYAAGKIKRVSTADATLTVLQPNSALPRPPGTSITVTWQTTSLPTTAPGVTKVRVRRTDAGGIPVSGADEISTIGLPLTQKSWKYDTAAVGRFKVTVEITFTDGSRGPLTADAPADVIVSTKPGIFWMGDLLTENPQLKGAIFEGVQFEDNAGSSFEGAEDFDGDGIDDFLITARYAKPEFINPTGVGVGEAYFIRGNATRFTGRQNLNAVGNNEIPGTVFTGIIPDPLDRTDGISRVFIAGDADGDGVGEIVFGFPNAWSMPMPFGVIGGLGGLQSTCGLSSSNIIDEPVFGEFVPIPQFRRGGVVAYSSQNDFLAGSNFDTSSPRVPLDFVGQTFPAMSVGPEPTDGGGDVCQSSWMADLLEWDDQQECDGILGRVGCVSGTDDEVDTLVRPRSISSETFDSRLANSYVCLEYDFALRDCISSAALCPACDDLCEGDAVANSPTPPGACTCDQFSLIDDPTLTTPLCSLSRLMLEAPSSIESGCDPEGCPIDAETQQPACECDHRRDKAAATMPGYARGTGRERRPRIQAFGTGVYPTTIATGDADNPTASNDPDPDLIGARIIGEQFNDGAGVSMTQSRNNFIMVSPFNLDGTNRGKGYVGTLAGRWSGSTKRPYQAIASGSVAIFGDLEELIEEVVGVPDFNQDTRDDIAIGAPRADVDNDGTLDGAVYIVYRRATTLEGDYILADLKRDTSDPERLSGLLVREALGEGQRFGASVAGDFQFNDDNGDGKIDSSDIPDVVVGNPDGNGGRGEVVIIFGSRDTISQRFGIPIEDDAGGLGLLSRQQGARIRGIALGSEFGSFVANIGDINGDGKNDLAIAAPNATPMFDSNIADNNDSLDPARNSFAKPGLDREEPFGVRDDVSGPKGIKNNSLVSGVNNDVNDELRNAGMVYVILSSTVATDLNDPADPVNFPNWFDTSVDQLGAGVLNGFILVGRRGERYANNTDANPPLHQGDFFGGGNAGKLTESIHGVSFRFGGNASKAPEAVLDLNNDPASPRLLSDGSPLTRDRGRAYAIGRAGDVDGDGRDDLLIGAPLADPRVDPITGAGARNGGEAYLIYGFNP